MYSKKVQTASSNSVTPKVNPYIPYPNPSEKVILYNPYPYPFESDTDKHSIIPTVYDATSFGISSVKGGVTIDIATNILAIDNEKYRPRSDKEKLIRSTIGLAGAGMAFSTIPVAGTVVGAGLLTAEVLESDFRGQKKMNSYITDNIMKDIKLGDCAEKKKMEELAREIIFDRCANRF